MARAVLPVSKVGQRHCQALQPGRRAPGGPGTPVHGGSARCCRLALSGGAATSTMRGGGHGGAQMPCLQKAARVADEAEQQLAPSLQAVCASW